VQSVVITTTVVSSNPAHGEVHFIQQYGIKFVSELSGIPLSSTNMTDRHDIIEKNILLKMSLDTITIALTLHKMIHFAIDLQSVTFVSYTCKLTNVLFKIALNCS
jgi:hypothetical protein